MLDVAAEEVVAARRQTKEEQDSAAVSAAAQDGTAEIYGDKQAKVYYLANCAPTREISEVNKIVFKSSEDAEKAGYKLAKGCH
jgi:hypothetical protein